jgi:hypothetical protein
LLGVVVGTGAVLFGPSVAPQVRRNLRPTAKAVVKTALEVAHAVQVRTAEIAEEIEDFVAEARAEAATQSDDRGAAPETAEAAAVEPETARPKRAGSRKRAPRRRKAP